MPPARTRARSAAVYRRIADADDPGIFIALVPEAGRSRRPWPPSARSIRRAAALGHPVRGEGQHRRRGPADDRRLPRLSPTRAAETAPRGGAAAGGRRARRRQDQSRPVRDRPRRRALALSRCRATPSIRPRAGRLELGLGGRGRGAGSSPSRSAPTRPGRAGCRRALNNIVGLKPTLGAVSTRGVVPACRTLDCVSVFALHRRAMPDAVPPGAWPATTRPTRSRARSPSAGAGGLPPGLRVGVPDAAGRRFGGDALVGGGLRGGASPTSRALGAELRRRSTSRRSSRSRRLLYDGPWVAERYAGDPRRSSRRGPRRCTRRRAPSSARRRGFSARRRLRGPLPAGRAAPGGGRGLDADRRAGACRPSRGRARVADLAADPIGPNCELGTYTNFVNLLDLCALAVPGRFRGGRLPVGRDADRAAPAATGCSRRSARACTRRRACRSARRARPLPARPSASRRRAERDRARRRRRASLGPAAERRADEPRRPAPPRGRRRRPTTGSSPCPAARPPAGPAARRGRRGAAIETEVWALPAGGFGRFVAAIPAPLGIGTLRLADGTRRQGLPGRGRGRSRGAEDISALRRLARVPSPAPPVDRGETHYLRLAMAPARPSREVAMATGCGLASAVAHADGGARGDRPAKALVHRQEAEAEAGVAALQADHSLLGRAERQPDGAGRPGAHRRAPRRPARPRWWPQATS